MGHESIRPAQPDPRIVEEYHGWRIGKPGYEAVQTFDERPSHGPWGKTHVLANGTSVFVSESIIKHPENGEQVWSVCVNVPGVGYYCFHPLVDKEVIEHPLV